MSSQAQTAILEPLPGFARYLTARLKSGADLNHVRRAILDLHVGEPLVMGIGKSLADKLDISPAQLREFPYMQAGEVPVPSTQGDLWLWFRASEPGEAVLAASAAKTLLSEHFDFEPPIDGFKFRESDEGLGKDLTGYEDGTENPSGDEAREAAIAADGSSFVAVQVWQHDMAAFNAMGESETDNIVGRRKSDNVEFEGSPESAHVKRTAQESFDPEAFVVRRSLPWADANGEGLVFVAFGHSLDAFEVQMRRMAGEEDDILDGLFRFSRPVTGAYYWCPPLEDGHLCI